MLAPTSIVDHLDKDADERRRRDYVVGQVSKPMKVGAAGEAMLEVTPAPPQHHLWRLTHTSCVWRYSRSIHWLRTFHEGFQVSLRFGKSHKK